MARISRDGAHSEMTADPKRRKNQNAGPTAAELNQAQQEFSEKQEKVQRTEKDATYTGKYLDAKMDLTSGAKQSYLDYQAGIAADETTLAQLDEEYSLNPTPELQQRRDALNASIERQKDALTVYEKSWRDSESSQETLQQQYGIDWQNYQTAFDEGTSSRNNYIELLSGYEGDDLENLSEDARADVQGVHKLVLCKVKSNLNDQLTEVNQEIEEIKEQISGVFSADPEFSNEANDLYFQNMEKLEVLEGQQKYLKTELYLLEGEMDRNDQKYEALKDPDFLKYVEKGYASMREMESFSRQMQSLGAGQPGSKSAAYSDAAVYGYEDIRFMSPMDQKIYAYYYAKDPSGQKAKAYKDSLQRQINESRNRPYLEWVLQNAEADPLGAGIASIPQKYIGMPHVLGEMVVNSTLPKEQKELLADPYTPGNTMLAGSQLSRQVGLDQIDNPMLKKGAEYMYLAADALPAGALAYSGLPGAAYLGAMRGADGYTAAALQGATVEEALQQGKINGAMGAYFGNRTLQGIGNILNGGFPWRPGTMAQQGGTPSDLTLPNLPGPASGMDFHSMSNVLGTQGAFQQLMKSNGYSMENALARPSAEQAYSILRSSGLDAGSAQQLLKSNGYHLDDATQLPSLLGDGEKDLLQRTEASSGEMLDQQRLSSALLSGDTKNPFTNGESEDIIASSRISGALNPEGKRAQDHAKRYYDLVRSMTTDVKKIAETTGYSVEEIQAIKNYIFIDAHELTDGFRRFDSDYMMGESWRRLIAGTPEPHDLTLIRHEIMERKLVNEGFTQDEAHRITSKTYNYGKEAEEFYGNIKKYKAE